jgi:hypothetical protein
MAEQVTASSHTLAGEVSELSSLLAEFKLVKDRHQSNYTRAA